MSLKSAIHGLFSVLLFLTPSMLLAQAVTAPPPGVKGYTVRVTNEFHADRPGYVPVKVSVSTNPTRTNSHDEIFTISVLSDSYQPEIKALSKKLILLAGTTSTSTEIYVPVGNGIGFDYQHELIIERGEGNQRFEYGRDLFRTDLRFSNFNPPVGRPCLLMISSSFQTINESAFVCYRANVDESSSLTTRLTGSGPLPTFEQLLPDFNSMAGIPRKSSAALSAIQNTDWLSGFRPSDIPEHWIGLSTVHQILISYADLKNISIQDSVRRESLEKWVAAGGSLIVFDLPKSYQDAPTVQPLLLGEIRNETVGQIDQTWREPTKKLLNEPRLIDVAGKYADYIRTYSRDEEEGDEPPLWVSLEDAKLAHNDRWHERIVSDGLFAKSFFDAETKPPFLILRHGQGRIITVESDMCDWTSNQWRQLQNGIAIAAIGSELVSHVAIDYPHNFSIPDVGEPPVIAFQVLLFLFIVLAGPVIFIVLQRARQMTLVFFLVPLLSLTACLGLLGYAILVDGFGSWGRLQTVSWLDQRTGSMLTESHAAYFHGSQPSPYSTPLDTITYVINEQSSDVGAMRQTPQNMSFSGGNVRARTPSGVASLRSYESTGKLSFFPNRSSETKIDTIEDDSPKLQNAESSGMFLNRLGAEVLYVAARTNLGLVEAKNIADGQQGFATASSAHHINTAVSPLIEELSPTSTSNYRDYQRSERASYDTEYSEIHSNRVNVINELRNQSSAALLREPNTYLAILAEFPDAMNQVEKVNYKKQLHVIIGKW